MQWDASASVASNSSGSQGIAAIIFFHEHKPQNLVDVATLEVVRIAFRFFLVS